MARMARKTVKLIELVEMVNKRNRLSTCSAETRKGWNDLVSLLLLKKNNYQGFSYLTQSEVPKGHKPGIEQIDGKNVFPDETRIVFHI